MSKRLLIAYIKRSIKALKEVGRDSLANIGEDLLRELTNDERLFNRRLELSKRAANSGDRKDVENWMKAEAY